MRVALCAIVLLCAACGRTPTAPTPPRVVTLTEASTTALAIGDVARVPIRDGLWQVDTPPGLVFTGRGGDGYYFVARSRTALVEIVFSARAEGDAQLVTRFTVTVQ